MKRFLLALGLTILAAAPAHADQVMTYVGGQSFTYNGSQFKVVYGTAALDTTNNTLTLNSGQVDSTQPNERQGLISLVQSAGTLPTGIHQADFTYTSATPGSQTGMFVYLQPQDYATYPSPARFEVGSLFVDPADPNKAYNGTSYKGAAVASHENYFGASTLDSDAKTFSASFLSNGTLDTSIQSASQTSTVSDPSFNYVAGQDFKELQLRVRGSRGNGLSQYDASIVITDFHLNAASPDAAAVPEPSTFALAITGGFFGLVGLARRRKAKLA